MKTASGGLTTKKQWRKAPLKNRTGTKGRNITKPDYYEVAEESGKTTFTFYTAEQWGAETVRRRKARAAEHQRIARKRQFRLFREAVGGLMILMGFTVTIAAGGCESFSEIVATAGCGVGLIGIGRWLAHAFRWQEKNAEWRRRLSRFS